MRAAFLLRHLSTKKPSVPSLERFEMLTPREHVLKRPETYVGSTQRCSETRWVVGARSQFELKEIEFVPALLKIFDEILVNAADNKRRDPSGTKEIRVGINAKTGELTVRNDGMGLPVNVHPKHKMYIPEMTFGHLLTGENFNDAEDRVVGGRNGFGAKLANIFSKTFKVTTCDGEKTYEQVWTGNMTNCSEPVVVSSPKAKSFTEISFTPDYHKFETRGLDRSLRQVLEKRVFDVAGVTRGMHVYLNDKKLECETFKDYVGLYSPQHPVVFKSLNERWEMAATLQNDDVTSPHVSFVNSICTTHGGTHVQFIQDKIVEHVLLDIEKNHKDFSVKSAQVKSHLWLFVNALIVNPSFSSQGKEHLTTKYEEFAGKEANKKHLPVLTPKILDEIVKSTGIVEKVIQSMQKKRAPKDKMSDLADKLDDAELAGSKSAGECTLVLTEGESAKSLALEGFRVVGREKFGVYPLRGKFLNVRSATTEQLTKEGSEMRNLCRILGLRLGNKYDSTHGLRYGRVLIMTDQDQDGSHIKGLIFNFFQAKFPGLMQVPGFLRVFVTPLVKASLPSSARGDLNEFYSAREYREWTDKILKQARAREIAAAAKAKRKIPSEDELKIVEKAELNRWKIKYYKGLGTNTSTEAKEYFTKFADHEMIMVYDEKTSAQALELAFDPDRVSDRKTWLSNYNAQEFVPVDFRSKNLEFGTFVNGELISFSLADNVRSIPSVIDGLKPSQRKILYACFKRNLVKEEMKVAQLMGYVAEHTAYHHGEQAIGDTIINMAQSFVGSNNIPLLEGIGNFGSRRQGGEDAASVRYIFTRLSPLARRIFHPDDDALLKRVEEDGTLVEPINYVPILPMILINGSKGIGTGWSTTIPSYDVHDIVCAIRQRLVKQQPPIESQTHLAVGPLVPSYKGFHGQTILEKTTVSVDGKRRTGKVVFRGSWVFDRPKSSLVITELPVMYWDQSFIKFLRKAQDEGSSWIPKGSIKDIVQKTPQVLPSRGAQQQANSSTSDGQTEFHLTLSSEFATTLSDTSIADIFQLETSVSLTNMHAFNADGKVQLYKSAEDIIDAFFPVRLNLYRARKERLEKELSQVVETLQSESKFVGLVVDGTLKVSGRKKDSIIADLDAMAFPKRFSSESSVAGYGYLVNKSIFSFTMEEVASLHKRLHGKIVELNVLKAKTPENLWMDDLDAFEQGLDVTEGRGPPSIKRK